MAQLILLVVAAAWLAVLIPPMLRSRVENRPNSSVTDFRRQLTKLENTATPPRGAVRAMGRPLAQSPLARPAAGGRPGQPQLRSGVTRHSTPSELAAQSNTGIVLDRVDDAPRFRSHGDPSGGHRRAAQREPRGRFEHDERAPRNEPRVDHRQLREHGDVRSHGDTRTHQREIETPHGSSSARRSHGDPSGGQRRPSNATGEIRTPAKQRRLNIMFILVVTSACTLFLAATTGSQAMFYAFVLSLLSLFGYIWMLAQTRQRATTGSSDGWTDAY